MQSIMSDVSVCRQPTGFLLWIFHHRHHALRIESTMSHHDPFKMTYVIMPNLPARKDRGKTASRLWPIFPGPVQQYPKSEEKIKLTYKNVTQSILFFAPLVRYFCYIKADLIWKFIQLYIFSGKPQRFLSTDNYIIVGWSHTQFLSHALLIDSLYPVLIADVTC